MLQDGSGTASELTHCLSVQVYDGTSFLKEHPGGGDSILLVAGTDATEEFDAIHSEKAKKQLLSFAIGRLANTLIGAHTLVAVTFDEPESGQKAWDASGEL